MDAEDSGDALRLIAVGIEAGLMRDGFTGSEICCGDFPGPDGWEPAEFAKRCAPAILAALQEEFEMRRRS